MSVRLTSLCVFSVMPQIFEYNGSALIAMVGKNCFAIASDRRLGVQLQTIATDFQRIYKVHDRLFLGLSGLATDAQTLYDSIATAASSFYLFFQKLISHCNLFSCEGIRGLCFGTSFISFVKREIWSLKLLLASSPLFFMRKGVLLNFV